MCFLRTLHAFCRCSPCVLYIPLAPHVPCLCFPFAPYSCVLHVLFMFSSCFLCGCWSVEGITHCAVLLFIWILRTALWPHGLQLSKPTTTIIGSSSGLVCFVHCYKFILVVDFLVYVHMAISKHFHIFCCSKSLLWSFPFCVWMYACLVAWVMFWCVWNASCSNRGDSAMCYVLAGVCHRVVRGCILCAAHVRSRYLSGADSSFCALYEFGSESKPELPLLLEELVWFTELSINPQVQTWLLLSFTCARSTFHSPLCFIFWIQSLAVFWLCAVFRSLLFCVLCSSVQRALFIEISLDCQTHSCDCPCHSCALSTCALSTCALSMFRSLLCFILWNLLIPKTWPLCRLVFCNTLFHMLGCMCALHMCALHTPLTLDLHLLIPQVQLCFAFYSVLLAAVLWFATVHVHSPCSIFELHLLIPQILWLVRMQILCEHRKVCLFFWTLRVWACPGFLGRGSWQMETNLQLRQRLKSTPFRDKLVCHESRAVQKGVAFLPKWVARRSGWCISVYLPHELWLQFIPSGCNQQASLRINCGQAWCKFKFALWAKTSTF